MNNFHAAKSHSDVMRTLSTEKSGISDRISVIMQLFEDIAGERSICRELDSMQAAVEQQAHELESKLEILDNWMERLSMQFYLNLFSINFSSIIVLLLQIPNTMADKPGPL